MGVDGLVSFRSPQGHGINPIPRDTRVHHALCWGIGLFLPSRTGVGLPELLTSVLARYEVLQYTVAVLVALTALAAFIKALRERRKNGIEIDPVTYLMANIERVERGAHSRMDRIESDVKELERNQNRRP